MYYIVIKHDGHLRTQGKCRKHEPQVSVFYISRLDNELPVGLIAQLEEHCTSITDVRVGVPLRPFLLLLKFG